MSITREFDIHFLVCICYLVIKIGWLWQATLKIIMNTSIHIISKTLSFSFELAKRILKDYRVFIWKSKVLQVLLTRRKRKMLNKESSKKWIREQTQGQMIPLWYFQTLEKECPVYLKEKRKVYNIFSSFNI